MPKALFVMTVALDFRAFLIPIANHFRTTGWRVDAASADISGNSDCQAGFDRIFDISWTRNPLNIVNFLRGLRQIRELVSRERYDIVHVHTPVAALLTRLALRNIRRTLPTTVIYTAHGFHFHPGASRVKNVIFIAIEALAARWTDFLVVINRTDEEAARKFIIGVDRLMYMPGIGVDTRHYQAAQVLPADVKRFRGGLGLTPGQPLFLMIAELNPGKRHRDALTALTLMNDNTVHLALAGIGPLQQAIERQIDQLGLAGRVHLLGYRRDIPVLIRASLATLLPSEREGLPRAIMESLSLEVPAIGTDIRGVKDLLADGCGLLVPVGDTQALAQAMREIVTKPELAAQMGQFGRRRMAEYDLTHIVQLHESLYQRVLNGACRK